MRRVLSFIFIIFTALLATLLAVTVIPHIISQVISSRLFIFVANVFSIIAGFVIWFVVLFRSDNAYDKLPWLLFIVIAPPFAILCFLTFGLSFKRSKRFRLRPLMHGKNYITHNKVDKYKDYNFKNIDDEVNEIFKFTHNISGHNIYKDNSTTTILNNGDEKFRVLKEKLNSAEKFIFMEYYIIREGKIASEILDILKKKAREGVEVKLIVDFFGGHISRKNLKSLKESGIEIIRFEKVVIPIFNTKLNYRLHRKITIIDAKYGFTGGLNLGDEYIHLSKKFGFWRDIHLMVEGPAVAGLTTVLLKDYYFQTGKLIKDDKYFITDDVPQEGYIQTIESGPDSDVAIISQTYIKMINQAKKSIKIMTPYISPSKELTLALRVAAMSGIDVSIIIPGKADKLVVYCITKSFFNSLLNSGVKIYLYKENFMHAKTLIIDDKIASVGTFNLDNRSESINFENTVIFSNSCVKSLSNIYAEDLTVSKEYTLEDYEKTSLVKKIIYSICNLFSPLA